MEDMTPAEKIDQCKEFIVRLLNDLAQMFSPSMILIIDNATKLPHASWSVPL